MNRIPAARAALALAALLSAGCGSSKPEPKREIDPGLPMAQEPQDKGQGHITFRYSNKTTDANLAIDLGSTDVYLEMSGKAAQDQADAMREAQAPPAPRKKPSKPAAPAQDDPEAASGPDDDDSKSDKPQPLAGLQPDLKKAKAQAKTAQEKKPEPPPEEEEPPYEDVTAKVLSGIRRAQELFYQKRYPEALQAVRSSLDARSTAEGHALAGSIHFMQGQNGMARRQWLEALRINPDMPAVVNMLEKTRTPGGRGSPSPRPVYRPAPPSAADSPYPEEYSSPAPSPAEPTHEASAPAHAPAPAAAAEVARPAPAPASQTIRPAPAAPAAPVEPAEEEAAPEEASAAPVAPAPAAAAPVKAAEPAQAAAPAAAAPAKEVKAAKAQDANKPPAAAPAKAPAPAPAPAKAPAKAAGKDSAKPADKAKAAKEEKK